MGNWLKFVALGGALMGAAAVGVLEETPTVPSGNDLYLLDQRVEQQGALTVLRLRYVMAAIAEQGHVFDDVAEDFSDLCMNQAVPQSKELDQKIHQVIISLSDRETEFGVSNPEATQYFEAFTLETDICIWEAF